MSDNSNESVYKYILIGDSCVGKTSILSKMISNKFSEVYYETIGVELLTKNITVNEKKLKIQIWDASGAEKYRSIVSAYFKGANGIIAVYDITNKNSFDSIKTQLKCYKNHICSDTSVIIIGNKSDLEANRAVNEEDLIAYANANNFLYIEVSAKTGSNIEESFNSLIKRSVSIKQTSLSKLSINLERNANVTSYLLPKMNKTSNSIETEMKSSSRYKLIDVNSNSFLSGSMNSFSEHYKKIIADVKLFIFYLFSRKIIL